MGDSTEFTFGDEEFLLIVNTIMRRETPLNVVFVPFTSMNDNFAVDRLDSLGMILFFTWLAELFSIEEDKVSVFIEAENFTIQDLKAFVVAQSRKSFTMEEFKELSKECM